jgi:5'-nucleotidase
MKKNMTTDVHDRIALFDMDGTLCDFDTVMCAKQEELRHPDEPITSLDRREEEPNYIRSRRKLIQAEPGFWRNLPIIELGFHILRVAQGLEFEIHVLTKNPSDTPGAATEKVEWCQHHIPGIPVTITDKKSMVYGRVLVDDWPPYFEKWLEAHPRGLVIVPAQSWNEGVGHPNVIRYTGENLQEVASRMQEACDRDSHTALM